MEGLEARLLFDVHNDSFDVTSLTALRDDPSYSAITGAGVTIAVLDTGVDAANPDLTSKVLAFYNAVEDPVPTTISSSSVSSAVDNDGHGTHVSGIAASADPNIGVAYGANLVDVKVVADSGESELGGDPLLRGLEFVQDFATQFNIKVVNMSLGEATTSGGVNDNTVPAPDDISEEITTLESMGITVVAAAGNSYANDPVPGESYPAVVSTISVANTWADTGAGYDFDTYSYGSEYDSYAAYEDSAAPDRFAATSQRSTLPNQVAAPGMNIYSDWNGSSTDNSGTDLLHNTLSGTSMAAPFVSGLVALIQQAALLYGGRYISDPNEVLTIIKDTSDQIVDSNVSDNGRVQISDGSLVSDTTYNLPETGDTFDRVNVLKAIEAVQALSTGTTSNADIDNTTTSATVVPDLNGTESYTESGAIGTDGLNDVGPNDVDLYKVVLDETGTLTAALADSSGGTAFVATVRLFSSNGTQLQIETGTSSAGYPSLTTADPLAAGTYYVGVSSAGNNSYDITNGSGATGGSATGDYTLTLGISNPDPNGVPQGAVAVDLTDPNYEFSDTNAVANLYNGILGSDPSPDGGSTRVSVPNGDVDMFKIVAPDTGMLTADVDTSAYGSQGADSYVAVFNSDYTQITSYGVPSDFPSNSEVTFQMTEGDVYYVAVTVDSNSSFSVTNPYGRVTNSTATPSYYDLYLTFNNGNTDGTALLAQQGTVGTPATGSISSSDPDLGADGGDKYVDWYTYTVGSSGLLDLSATATSSGFVPNVELWTLNSDSTITEVGAVTGSGTPLIDQLAADTKVYVSVTGSGNSNFNWFSLGSGSGGDTGSYTLTSSLLGTTQLKTLSDNSINDGTPGTITVGQAISANIGQDGGLIVGSDDVDLYKFTPTTTGLYDIRTDTSQEGSADTLLRLFDSTGNQISENDNASSATTASYIRAQLTGGVSYYIGVSGSGNAAYSAVDGSGAVAGSTGNYVVSINSATVSAASVAAAATVQQPAPGETTNAIFTVSLDIAPASAVTVEYTTSDGTAVAGTDYTATSGTLTFAAGQTSQQVSVPILYDANANTDQTFYLNLSTTDSNVIINGGEAQATITNLPVTKLNLTAKTPVTYTDANGHKVIVRLAGAGSGTISLIGANASGGVQVTLNDTTDASRLAVTTSTTATTAWTLLQVNGSLALLSAARVELQGDLTVTGTVKSLTLAGATGGHTLSIDGSGAVGSVKIGDVSDLTFSTAEPLASLVVADWLNTTGAAETITAPSIATLTSTGAFSPAVALSGQTIALRSARIDGALGGAWTISGAVGNIVADSISSAWNATFDSSITSLGVLGDDSGTLTAATIGTVRIDRDFSDASLTLTGGTAAVGNTRTPSIDSLLVAGEMDNSSIRAAGNIIAMQMGALVDSTVFAGVSSSTTAFPTTASVFTAPAEILRFKVTGLAGQTFAFTGSTIAAEELGTVTVRRVQTDNSGTAFGFATETLGAFSDAEVGQSTFVWRASEDPGLLTFAGDFKVTEF